MGEQPRIRLAVAEPILHDILGRDLIALLRQRQHPPGHHR
jgi:hypothetical protein